jgi:hypothetical protein
MIIVTTNDSSSSTYPLHQHEKEQEYIKMGEQAFNKALEELKGNNLPENLCVKPANFTPSYESYRELIQGCRNNVYAYDERKRQSTPVKQITPNKELDEDLEDYMKNEAKRRADPYLNRRCSIM